MKLFGFTFCRNEEKLIPYVMPYIERMGYDKFIVYDNESTDNTVEILKQYPFIEVRSFHTDKFDDAVITRNFLNVYQECMTYINNNNGETVWLSRTDFDEVLFLDGAGCCPGKGVLGGEYINNYNVYDGKMVELICDESTIQNPSKMAHTWKNIRGKYWQVYGNKPLLMKVNDFPLPFDWLAWGNHLLITNCTNEKGVKHLQDTGYVYAFHLKWLDINLLKERTIEMAKRTGSNTINKDLIDKIDRYYEESLLPLSFPLYEYFLIEGNKTDKIGGLKLL